MLNRVKPLCAALAAVVALGMATASGPSAGTVPRPHASTAPGCALADPGSGAALACGAQMLGWGLPLAEGLLTHTGVIGGGQSGRSSGPGPARLDLGIPAELAGQVGGHRHRPGRTVAAPSPLSVLATSGEADLPPPLSWA